MLWCWAMIGLNTELEKTDWFFESSLPGAPIPALGEVLAQCSCKHRICLSCVVHHPRLHHRHRCSWGHAWARVSSFCLALLLAQCDMAPRWGDRSSVGPGWWDSGEHFTFISVVSTFQLIAAHPVLSRLTVLLISDEPVTEQKWVLIT